MDYKIFYSWQTDLPNATNRSFILSALEKAAEDLAKDASVEVEPVVDRDTVGITGSPDITSAIFDKIEQAQVFVADISIINAEAVELLRTVTPTPKPRGLRDRFFEWLRGCAIVLPLPLLRTPPIPLVDSTADTTSSRKPSLRLTPNPNVLLELGYAARHLRWEQIILVMNTEFGKVEDLPFDLRMRRVLTYTAKEGEENRGKERKKLVDAVKAHVRETIQNRPHEPIGEPIRIETPAEAAVRAMEDGKPNQGLMVQRFWKWLLDELIAIAPDYSDQSLPADEVLYQSILETPPLLAAFAKVAQVAAAIQSSAITDIATGFELLLNRYDLPKGFSGHYCTTDFDFFKFVGYDLYVAFISALLTEKRWNELQLVLTHSYYPERRMEVSVGHNVAVNYVGLSREVGLLEGRKQRLQLLQRGSLHADLIWKLHTEGELAQTLPMERFTEAEVFLFLRSEADNTHGLSNVWVLRATHYLNSPPRFILEAVKRTYASAIAPALGASSVEELRVNLLRGLPYLYKEFGQYWLNGPRISTDMINAVGTQ